MKVLFDHALPFALAHGGSQIQIEQSRAALVALGLEVEFLKWWDSAQQAEVIHFFGRPHPLYIEAAHQKNTRVVISELLGGTGARPKAARAAQRVLMSLARSVLPKDFTARLAWDAYRLADAVTALTPWEAALMREMFLAPAHKVHVVPNGVEEVFFKSGPQARGPWLVCTATVTPVKQVVEVGKAAVVAQTPLWVIGKPYSETDPYARQFLDLAGQHPELVRYEGPVADRAALAQIYRQARGFVLLSKWESLSLSALEAAACGCPLLLSDLPWAHSVFGSHARYCSPHCSTGKTAQHLRAFYADTPNLAAPPRPKTWLEVGQHLKGLYESLLSTSR